MHAERHTDQRNSLVYLMTMELCDVVEINFALAVVLALALALV